MSRFLCQSCSQQALPPWPNKNVSLQDFKDPLMFCHRNNSLAYLKSKSLLRLHRALYLWQASSQTQSKHKPIQFTAPGQTASQAPAAKSRSVGRHHPVHTTTDLILPCLHHFSYTHLWDMQSLAGTVTCMSAAHLQPQENSILEVIRSIRCKVRYYKPYSKEPFS